MKRIVGLILSLLVILTVIPFTAACTPRDEILRVYNWGEYMDNDAIEEGFAAWYKTKTGGKSIDVVFEDFDSNEEMYQSVVEAKDDFDVICPSDYMLERMQIGGHLEKLSKATLDVINEAANPLLRELMPDNTLDYSMPYIWGTLGIMYNYKWAQSKGYTKEEMSSYSVLFEGEYGKGNKVLMKDSVRDGYSAAMIYKNKTTLTNLLATDKTGYRLKLESIFDIDQMSASDVTANIATAEAALKAQKSNYRNQFGSDELKEDIFEDDGETGLFGLFWSCDAGDMMNGYEDSYNQNLMYVVPEEGSNVWVDAFAIPKNAGNKSAANLFIQYLCDRDVAYDCMDAAGGTSGITLAAADYKAMLEADDGEFFKSENPQFRQMYMDMMFPRDEVLERCAVMRDFGGTYNLELSKMWQRVKTA